MKNPESFSDPIPFDFFGIDPSLFLEDDKAYVQGSFIFGYRKKPATTIMQGVIDLKTAKADNPWGPFQSYEGNPILTMQGPSDNIQCVGHAELFDDLNSNWWCVMIARREFGSSYLLGRETYLTPVFWPQGEFPQIDTVRLEQPLPSSHKLARSTAKPARRKVTLGSLYTIYLRGLDSSLYRESDPSLFIKASSPLGAQEGTVAVVGHRQTSLASVANVILNTKCHLKRSQAGLSLYKDTFRYAAIEVDAGGELSLVCLQAGEATTSCRCIRPIGDAEALTLTIRSTVEKYVFSYAAKMVGEWSGETELGTVSTAVFSRDDFTGKSLP